MSRHIETFRIVWHEIAIEVRWEPNWLNLTAMGYDSAHLEIESIVPERAPLPITETGYRSHFTSPEAVAAYGGPVAYVEAWLEMESQTPYWQRQATAARQFTLF
jgi:hypothetical protein